jgi:alkaline phosphatase
MKRSLIIYFLLLPGSLMAQEYSSSSIFSHNDYEQKNPFYNAYDHQIGFIEADVFLDNNELLVAHSRSELNPQQTLEILYLKPLQEKIKLNKGNIYADPSKALTLMIDLKTEGISTLNAIVVKLKTFPELLSCKTLTISISGNVPDRERWKDFPSFIYFDGRPGIDYTTNELQRISFVSTSFGSHSTWKGKASLPEPDRQKLSALRDAVHAKGKKLRFWGAPDVPAAWQTWMELKIDILGTDKVSELNDFVKAKKTKQ